MKGWALGRCDFTYTSTGALPPSANPSSESGAFRRAAWEISPHAEKSGTTARPFSARSSPRAFVVSFVVNCESFKPRSGERGEPLGAATATPDPTSALARRLPTGTAHVSSERAVDDVGSPLLGARRALCSRMQRTFAIGDVHGDLEALTRVMSRLPALSSADTLVFLGDYVDRGPRSREVMEYVMLLPERTAARVVAIRGNHEDAWLRVLDEGWDNFVLAPASGALATLRSFTGRAVPHPGEAPSLTELDALSNASFFPDAARAWLRSLRYWYEDEHAIYVHGCLPVNEAGSFPHPREVSPPSTLCWCSEPRFFTEYRGKRVVVGHTSTRALPQALSEHTPHDPLDLFQHGDVFGLDTGSGDGGFLTALELPALRVYESRARARPTSGA